MDLELAEKIVIVTGAGNGIGRATAAAFHSEGAKVALFDIDGKAAAAAAAELGDDRALAVTADVVDLTSVEAGVAAVRERWESAPQVVVNNAGFPLDGFLTKIAVDDWNRVVDVVLRGAFNCCRATMQGMHELGWGRVVNVSSRSHLGNPGQTNYSAAKAGLLGFTRALALESGRFGVTVNAVAPGTVETEGMLALDNWDVLRERSLAKTPLGRIGRPDEIASTILFLASDRAAYITGEVVHATGGRYA